MGSKGPGCGSVLAGSLAFLFLLYYGFHDMRLGWIVKTVFVLFALIVLAVLALVIWIIVDRIKKDKLAEEEKIRQDAEQSLRRIQERRERESGSESQPE